MSGLEDVLGGDVEQAGVRGGVAAVVETAGGVAEDLDVGTGKAGAVAGGVGGAEEGKDRSLLGGGEVDGAGVAAENESGVAGEGDELGDGAGDEFGARFGGDMFWDRAGFRGGVDEDSAAGGEEAFCEGDVAVGGPLLGAPTGGGAEEDVIRGVDGLGEPGLGGRSDGEVDGDGLDGGVGGGGEEFAGLVDDVGTVERDAGLVEDAGLALAGMSGAEKAGGGGEAADDGGADGALEVYGEGVGWGAEGAAKGGDLAKGGDGKGALLPGAGGDEVDGVDDLRGEEWGPVGLDGPADVPVRVGLAEGGDGGKSVKDVAHRSGAEDEETGWGKGGQGSIFAWGSEAGEEGLTPIRHPWKRDPRARTQNGEGKGENRR